MDETGRIGDATSAGDGSGNGPGLGSSLHSLDADPEHQSLATAAAAVITARWRSDRTEAWAPPEQKQWTRATPVEPERSASPPISPVPPMPLPPYVARGSASVAGFTAPPAPPPNGNGSYVPAPVSPVAPVAPVPLPRRPGVPIEPLLAPQVAEPIFEPAPFDPPPSPFGGGRRDPASGPPLPYDPVVPEPRYDPDAFAPGPYEPFSSGTDLPPYEPPPYEPPRYEPPRYEPAAYEPAGYEPAAYEPLGYEPAAYEPVPYPAPYEPTPYEPPPYLPSYPAETHEPAPTEQSGFEPEPPTRTLSSPAAVPPLPVPPLAARATSSDPAVPHRTPTTAAAPAPGQFSPSRSRMEQLDIDTEPMLPQRVPSEPDVPDVPRSPHDPLRQTPAEPLTDRGKLSRIAKYLRYDNVDEPIVRRDGFDVDAILAAVRTVPDVADAKLRRNPNGVHTLRIDLVDGADAGRVSREVARLLAEEMGLAAEPSGPAPPAADETTLDRPATGRARLRPYVAAVAAQADAAQAATRAGAGEAAARGVAQNGGRAVPRPDRAADGGGESTRVVLDHVKVTTLGQDATVEVRLIGSAGRHAVGVGHGPAIDGYLLRLSATSAAEAIDQLLVDPGTGTSRGRCLIEHVGVVPFGGCEIAVVVLLLVCGGVAEQLCGSAIVSGDPRQTVVQATLSAVNRRLDDLIP